MVMGKVLIVVDSAWGLRFEFGLGNCHLVKAFHVFLQFLQTVTGVAS
jgi:hypothetical protein